MKYKTASALFAPLVLACKSIAQELWQIGDLQPIRNEVKMKLNQIITEVTNFRPSELTAEQLTTFVNEVNLSAFEKVFNKAEDNDIEYEVLSYPADSEKELIIPDEFCGVYRSYLLSKIDYYNAEVDRYNMDSQMYQAEWDEFAAYWRRNYTPK